MRKCNLFLVFCLFSITCFAQEFITVWDLSKSGLDSNKIKFNIQASGNVSYNWTTVPAGISGTGILSDSNCIITGLPSKAKIKLMIDTLNLDRFYMADYNAAKALIDIEQWGSVKWKSMASSFIRCSNLLTITATDMPNLNLVTNMDSMFSYCYISNISNINNWNTSNITSMAAMFSNTPNFNLYIGNWNTSNVKNMSNMFNGSISFNQSINQWNVSNVESMEGMFQAAFTFNKSLNNWNTASVTNMQKMFENTKVFNSDISNWNTGNCTNMSFMLANSRFNNTIGDWNTSKVTNMAGMFKNNYVFDQEIGNWNTSSVLNMDYLFSGTINFNSPINLWNTKNVNSMLEMFFSAKTFNQPIGNWDIGKVQNLSRMFSGAILFNQFIGNWNTSNVLLMDGMFANARAFNQNINNWNTQNVLSMGSMFMMAITFNQDLNNWNTAKVTYMSSMFESAIAFNGNISNWQTASVINMNRMFKNSHQFNMDLGKWNTNNLESSEEMFMYAKVFNKDIGDWNTSKITNMYGMFHNAESFDIDISNWNTGNVINMGTMFFSAISFNQDLNQWDISKVTSMNQMFYNAISYNKKITQWSFTVPNLDLNGMLDYCGLDCTNYSETIIAWSKQTTITTNVFFSAKQLLYNADAFEARSILKNNKNWKINGDSLNKGFCCETKFTNQSYTISNTYFWANNLLTESGNYTDTFKTLNECDSIVTLKLIIKTDSLIAIKATSLNCIIDNANYQWILCNPYSIINGATNQSFTPTQSADYAVIVSINGNIDTSACVSFQKFNLLIAPNPCIDRFTINSTFNLQGATIIIKNIFGQRISAYSLDYSTKIFTTNLANYASGIYFIEVFQKDIHEKFKLVKK